MRYEIRAMRGAEGVVALTLEAADESDAMAQIRLQGYTVLSAKPQTSFKSMLPMSKTSFPLILFNQELLSLLSAGLSLVEALETLGEKEHKAESRKILEQIVASLYEGKTLSFALQKFPEHFPYLYIASIKASEKTGDIPEALERFIAYQVQLDHVKRHVISASIYPLLLMGVGLLVTLFLMVYVVPRFSRVYSDISADLPLFSRLLMRWGQLLEQQGLLIATVSVLTLTVLVFVLSRKETKLRISKMLWNIPALGTRLRVYQLARFYRALGMLLRGGISIIPALQMVKDLLQVGMRGQLSFATTAIREGMSISRAMEDHQLSTPVAGRMLRVGERTGQMGEMMERIAAFHDEETTRWVERFTKLFEPLLMVFIGLMIGCIVVLMYLPIFELAGSIQ
ncbi:MAG: type II secretion system F family protein [Gallionella sp.]